MQASVVEFMSVVLEFELMQIFKLSRSIVCRIERKMSAWLNSRNVFGQHSKNIMTQFGFTNS